MLEYSRGAKRIKPRFHKFYNEIEVYVEDEDDENFYEKLLKQIIGDLVKIGRVFGVGGKRNLYDKVGDYMSGRLKGSVFFIADGDFERLLNSKIPVADRFHMLEEYCIENYLFEEEAICKIIQEEKPRLKIRRIKKDMKIPECLEVYVNELTSLFACFIFVQIHKLGEANVKIGIGRFISNGGIPRLEKRKIDRYVDRVRKSHPVSEGKEFDKEIREIIKAMGDNWRERKRYICGKNYLLPLLRFEMKRYSVRDLETKSLRLRLANHCSFGSLVKLKEQVKGLGYGN